MSWQSRGFTSKELEGLRALFSALDADDDGFVSFEEITKVFDASDKSFDKKEIDEFMALMGDKNGDGRISLQELLDFFTSKS